MLQMLYHSHSMQACEKRRCNYDVTIGPMCPIMSSIFQCSNVSQPLKENIYLLCSGAPCRRTRTSLSSATTHFTSFNCKLKCTLNDQCVSIQITLMHNLAIISQILDNQLMFAIFICKKTSWLLYASIDSLD